MCMLLAQILADPAPVPRCRQHPWFTVHLPRYLAVMQVCDSGVGRRGAPGRLQHALVACPAQGPRARARVMLHASLCLNNAPHGRPHAGRAFLDATLRLPAARPPSMRRVAPHVAPNVPPPPPLQADPVAAGTHIDEDILREVVRLGFTRDFVAESLKTRQQNKVGGVGRGWGGQAGGRVGLQHKTGCSAT